MPHTRSATQSARTEFSLSSVYKSSCHKYGPRLHDPERVNHVSTTPHHTLKRTASSCSPGKLENGYVEEGRDKALPLECLHFAINPHLMERFWHLSRYFFALADRQNDYLNTMFTRDVALYRIYQKYDPF